MIKKNSEITGKSALMITGGFVYTKDLRSFYEHESLDYIIGVDGGCKIAKDSNIVLDIMYGDFDTLDFNTKTELLKNNIDIHELSPNKDITDTHGAFIELIEKGINSVTVFGSTGNRMDHTLANMMVPFSFIDQLKITYYDRNNCINFYSGPTVITKSVGRYKYLSIIPIEKTLIIKTRGLKYEVENRIFDTYDSFGVSNEAIGEYEIIVEYGKFMIIEASD